MVSSSFTPPSSPPHAIGARGEENLHQQHQSPTTSVSAARSLRRLKRKLLLQHVGVELPPTLLDVKISSPVSSSSCSPPTTPKPTSSSCRRCRSDSSGNESSSSLEEEELLHPYGNGQS